MVGACIRWISAHWSVFKLHSGSSLSALHLHEKIVKKKKEKKREIQMFQIPAG